ncbi:soluble cytochrome b562 [Povalibacter uvarum]|uniref:Soluble cytochrome b562 n=1 Tax=Povalibacter uvarum TaxID=732238 RepID=A0A841HT78_9GAMM|nr:hypothetical protein [Povalibacter uvarum]MBB6096086.1 soluble cytochrome b562 [Povalibacter uvarum]
MSIARILGVVALTALGAVIALPAVAQTARPGDKAVEGLIEQVEKSANTFQKALDKDIKKATVRGAQGEVDVKAFLEDFKTSIERLKERFDKKYAASAELNAVMSYADGMEKFIQSQAPTLKGRSEWDEFKASLNNLAGAYGSNFPNATNPPRRMNDLEIQDAAAAAGKNGDNLKRELKTVFGKEDKAGIEAAEGSIEAMHKAAKALKSRVDDGKPASGEAVAFVEAVRKVDASVAGKTLPAKAKTASDGIGAAVAKVEQAFNIPAAKAAAAPAT